MKVYDFDQYSPEWWTTRKGVPTASEFGSIITPKKGELSKSCEAYICRLIGDRLSDNYGEVDDYVSAAMKNGTMMEPEARAFYEMTHDVDVKQVGFCLTDDGRFGCSPDGLIGEDGGFEAKAPEPHTQIKYLLDGGLPDQYKPQVHGSLIVTGRNWWDFLSYSPGLPPLLVRVTPDDYTEQLRKALEEFWTMYQEAWCKIQAMQPEREPAPEPKEVPILF